MKPNPVGGLAGWKATLQKRPVWDLGNIKLDTSQQCAHAAKVPSSVLGLNVVKILLKRRKKCSTRAIKYWNRLPRKAVECPSLVIIQKTVQHCLSNPLQLSLLCGKRLDPMILRGTLQPPQFSNSELFLPTAVS